MKKFALLYVATCLCCLSPDLCAQDADADTEQDNSFEDLSDDDFMSGEIDPNAPLDPLPDMEVDWPDFEELPPLPEVGVSQNAEAPEDSEVVEGIAEDDVLDIGIPEAELAGEETGSGPLATDIPEENALAGLDDDSLDYSVKLDYLEADTFADNLREQFEERFAEFSKLRDLEDDTANVAQIARRAQEDLKLLDELLRIYGYYDAEIYQAIDRADTDSGLRVNFALQLGPLYRYGVIDLGELRSTGSDYERFRALFALQTGEPINSDNIVAAKLRLDEGLAESGYAFAQLGEPELVIDHADRTGDLSVPVMPDHKYSFGQIIVSSDPLLSARHIQRIARFSPGDLYQRSKVDDLRRALVATGLISSLKLTTEAADDTAISADGDAPRQVNLRVETVAAPLRTIAGELGYGTGEGIRAEVSWEHRNFFPPEGLVRARGVAGTQEQLVSLLYRRNNFKKRDQVLSAQFLVSNIERNAFDARTILFSAGLERQSNLIFQKKWTWSIGAELIATDERDITADNLGTRRRTFFIGALPGTLYYDGSDDLLNPTTGFRLGGRLSPEISLQDDVFGYARMQLDASYYKPVSERVVMAGRVRLGSIAGADLLQIAPSRRLYTGGGGSVRGYAFQAIGPRDINNDPIGGKSLVEFSLEARIRFGNFGVVPFVDAGNIYTDSVPDFSGLRVGAGVGFRYYSSFGPIRLDVGTPLNPQPGDSRIGVYVSLGQAF